MADELTLGETLATPTSALNWESDAALVRSIVDYPTPGTTFRDITPLLGDGAAFGRAVDALVGAFGDVAVDGVVGVESRGLIIAAPVAYRLGVGFVPVRKAGKLPWAVAREEYETDTGTDKLEIHRDAIHPGERVLVIDDVLATGATASAAIRLVEGLGGTVVGLGVMVELLGFGGRGRLGSHRIERLMEFDA